MIELNFMIPSSTVNIPEMMFLIEKNLHGWKKYIWQTNLHEVINELLDNYDERKLKNPQYRLD